MNKIVCPNCKNEIEISEAISHKIRDEEREKARSEYNNKLEKQKQETEQNTDLRIKNEVEKARLEAQKKFEDKNKKTLLQIEEAEKAQRILQEKIQTSEKDQKEREEKIKQEAVRETFEKSRLDKLEYEKKINDMQKALEVAQRKGKQGSQQLQGEVMELDLEEKLKATFPNDEFFPIPKGIEGGDIWQKVKYKDRIVGAILWEAKRTKKWEKLWIAKLKDDSAKINVSEAIIVSDVLPNGITNFDRKDGIWLTTYEHAIGICRYIRFLITNIASIKSSVSQSEEEWGKIRDYMMSDTFRHRMQGHFDSIKILRDDLDGEKRSTMIRWKRRENQIEKLDSNTINFYGELKSIVPNLPGIKGIEIEETLEKTQQNLLEERNV